MSAPGVCDRHGGWPSPCVPCLIEEGWLAAGGSLPVPPYVMHRSLDAIGDVLGPLRPAVPFANGLPDDAEEDL